ncbi:hypothetical protein AEQU3_02270 [Aequorivita antarctica]|nr:hypothetical protein AEQU3_02270 [Aequorivita antarctica]
MEKTKITKYPFEFYFYNKYAFNFEKYFDNKDRITIWSETNEKFAFPAEFSNYKVLDDKILGTLILLTKEDRNLYDIENRKYFMNHPDNLVGHLILLDKNREI